MGVTRRSAGSQTNRNREKSGNLVPDCGVRFWITTETACAEGASPPLRSPYGWTRMREIRSSGSVREYGVIRILTATARFHNTRFAP
jgi:hypothetical protein